MRAAAGSSSPAAAAGAIAKPIAVSGSPASASGRYARPAASFSGAANSADSRPGSDAVSSARGRGEAKVTTAHASGTLPRGPSTQPTVHSRIASGGYPVSPSNAPAAHGASGPVACRTAAQRSDQSSAGCRWTSSETPAGIARSGIGSAPGIAAA